MRRLLVLAAAAIAVAALVGFAGPAGAAVPTFAYSWAVPCNDSDGVSTLETGPGFEFVPGTYAVTVAGACSYATTSFGSAAESTPCTAPIVGAVPCAGVTVNNIPGALCATSFSAARVLACFPNATEPSGPTTCSTFHHVRLNGQCLNLVNGGAALITTTTVRPFDAHFYDDGHSDNLGLFVVTAVRVF